MALTMTCLWKRLRSFRFADREQHSRKGKLDGFSVHRELLGAALDKGYAVGYFESWNLESLRGVIDAAEAAKSPVIIGFNGEFLTAPSRLAVERIRWGTARLGRAAAEGAGVPCGLIFNECPLDAARRGRPSWPDSISSCWRIRRRPMRTTSGGA